MVEAGDAGAERAAVSSTASCFRAARWSRRSTCARASASSAPRYDVRTRLLVVESGGRMRRADRGRRARVHRDPRGRDPAAAGRDRRAERQYLDGIATLGDRIDPGARHREIHRRGAVGGARSGRGQRVSGKETSDGESTAQRQTANGHGARGDSTRALLDAGRSDHRRRPATIARIADEVSDGAEAQVRSLDAALSGVERAGASLEADRRPGRVGRGVGRGAGVVDQRSGGVDRAGLAPARTRSWPRFAEIGDGDRRRRARRSRR